MHAHTWYEGIQVCKTRSQSSKTVVGQQLNSAQQKDIGSSHDADMANGKAVIATSKMFAFASANTSPRSMSDKTSIATATYTPDNVFTTTPAHLLMTNTPRVYFEISSANNTPTTSSLTILTIIIHMIIVVF